MKFVNSFIATQSSIQCLCVFEIEFSKKRSIREGRGIKTLPLFIFCDNKSNLEMSQQNDRLKIDILSATQ